MAKETKKQSKGPLPPKRRLKTPEDIRRFLADTVNRLNRDEIDSTKAGRLGYLCSIMVKIVEASDLAKRIEALEVGWKGSTDELTT